MLLERQQSKVYLLLHWCEPSRIGVLVFSSWFIRFGTQVQNIICFTNGMHHFTWDRAAHKEAQKSYGHNLLLQSLGRCSSSYMYPGKEKVESTSCEYDAVLYDCSNE